MPALAPVSWRFRINTATLFNAAVFIDMKGAHGMADRTQTNDRFPGRGNYRQRAFWRLEMKYSDPAAAEGQITRQRAEAPDV
ncbi:hypothetical protein KCP75_06165 [Salmonella enterica subsp. enterica]|nr:hypothetical protein KCP75_06165 [Salmonella enterica subsp. enterica]